MPRQNHGTTQRKWELAWNILRQIPTDSLVAEPGDHMILFDGEFTGDGAAMVRIEFRVMGSAEMFDIDDLK